MKAARQAPNLRNPEHGAVSYNAVADMRLPGLRAEVTVAWCEAESLLTCTPAPLGRVPEGGP